MPGNIVFKPIEANLTRGTEFLFRMNPYCSFSIGDQKFKGKACSKGGKHPTWSDSISIPFSDASTAKLELMDKDLITKDDLIGSCEIDLKALTAEGSSNKNWHKLFYENQPAGEILLEATFEGDFDRNAWSRISEGIDKNLESSRDVTSKSQFYQQSKNKDLSSQKEGGFRDLKANLPEKKEDLTRIKDDMKGKAAGLLEEKSGSRDNKDEILKTKDEAKGKVAGFIQEKKEDLSKMVAGIKEKKDDLLEGGADMSKKDKSSKLSAKASEKLAGFSEGKDLLPSEKKIIDQKDVNIETGPSKFFTEQHQSVEPRTFKKDVEVYETVPREREIEVLEQRKVMREVEYTEAVPVKKIIEIVEPTVVKKEIEVIEPRVVTKTIEVIENVPVKKTVEVVEMKHTTKEIETMEPQTKTRQVEVTEQVPVMKTVKVNEPVTSTKQVEFVQPVITTQTITKEIKPEVIVNQTTYSETLPATLKGATYDQYIGELRKEETRKKSHMGEAEQKLLGKEEFRDKGQQEKFSSEATSGQRNLLKEGKEWIQEKVEQILPEGKDLKGKDQQKDFASGMSAGKEEKREWSKKENLSSDRRPPGSENLRERGQQQDLASKEGLFGKDEMRDREQQKGSASRAFAEEGLLGKDEKKEWRKNENLSLEKDQQKPLFTDMPLGMGSLGKENLREEDREQKITMDQGLNKMGGKGLGEKVGQQDIYRDEANKEELLGEKASSGKKHKKHHSHPKQNI